MPDLRLALFDNHTWWQIMAAAFGVLVLFTLAGKVINHFAGRPVLNGARLANGVLTVVVFAGTAYFVFQPVQMTDLLQARRSPAPDLILGILPVLFVAQRWSRSFIARQKEEPGILIETEDPSRADDPREKA